MPWRYWSSGLVGSRKAPGSVISKGIGRQTYTHLYILEMMENLTAKVATSCYSIAQFSQKGVQVDKKVHLTAFTGFFSPILFFHFDDADASDVSAGNTVGFGERWAGSEPSREL